MITLRIEQGPPQDGKYPITLRQLVDGVQKRTAAATIEFTLSDQEQEELRWYLEDYLQKASVTAPVVVDQITGMIRQRGIELYQKVFTANANTQAVWFAIRDHLADLRIEISTGIAEAASIPWELMRDPELDSAIALRVKAFVRVQSDPNIAFINVPPLDDSGRLRLLYIVCRPSGSRDVPLRALVNRILQDLGADRDRFDITALRPPTFEQLQAELGKAKAEGRPYHIVHFDGHGVFADLGGTTLADWIGTLSSVVLGGEKKGKHGYLLFEHPGREDKMQPVDGAALGQLLHDHGSPVLVLNACQTAMHEAQTAPSPGASVHEEIRAIGSLSQAVIDQGVPAVLGMRYSVYVVTAAQYIGELYRGLAQGQSFGEAASTGRKHLFHNPERWLGLQPQTLQDWCVPVVHEARPISLLPPSKGGLKLGGDDDRDPVQSSALLRRYVPESGFIGRDETLLALDRGFDQHHIVLLHAYAGQGKSSTAVEFARWYALTGGLGPQPIVLFSSFEQHLDLASLLNQLATPFLPMLEANGIHWHAINEPEKRRKLVLDILRQIPVLWIWDNVESIAGFPAGTPSQWTVVEQEELRDFLKQIAIDTRSQVKLLLTSRRDELGWLGQLPHRIKMPRMSDEDAATLAQQLGEKKHITRSEVADWQPLLDYCSGNPLTLRVLVCQALKMGLRGSAQLQAFTAGIRSGEHAIHDADEKEGRDRSLGASLSYGFKHAFKDDELPIIALLHLFHGTVLTDVMEMMGKQEGSTLPELNGWSKVQINQLLHRAAEIGLIDHLWYDRFSIHPALPWFLNQLFNKYYDGQEGRSNGEAALRAWVVATADRASFSHRRFQEGKMDVVKLLELDEANILHARSSGRLHRWWKAVTSAMQGIRCLYGHHGRHAEWGRLVEEIVPDYCTASNEPVPGREESFSLVMEYRLSVAKRKKDENAIRELHSTLLNFNRQQAAEALSLPFKVELTQLQRIHIHLLAVSLANIGDDRRQRGDTECIAMYEEAVSLCDRINNKSDRASLLCSLGHAFRDIAAIRDFERSAAAYQASLSMRVSTGQVGCVDSLMGLAQLSNILFHEAAKSGEPRETCLTHANNAIGLYQEALAACPDSAVNSLAPIHCNLGTLFAELRYWDEARKNYEEAAKYAEVTNRWGAGLTRHNLAVMYYGASLEERDLNLRASYLRRAEAYAQAAIRDFQRYQGRAATDEKEAQVLLDEITRELQLLQD